MGTAPNHGVSGNARSRWSARILFGLLLAGAPGVLSYVGGAPWWLSFTAIAPGVLLLLLAAGWARREAAHGSARTMDRTTDAGDGDVVDLAGATGAAVGDVNAASEQHTPRQTTYDVSWDRDAKVLYNLDEPVLSVDEDGILEWSNAAANRLLGLEAQGLGARNLLQHVRDEVPESTGLATALETGLETVATLGADGQHRIRLVTFGNREFNLLFLYQPKGRDAVLGSTAIIFTEVTLRNQIVRLKDGILSCVSHELRTPLTNICATAEILRDMPPANIYEAQEFLKIMTKESMHLARVVDDIMEVSLLESDQAVLETSRVNLAAILRAAPGRAQEQIDEAGLDVRVEVESEDLFCLADRRRLQQVADKLLDNAIKFTPAGGSIRMRASSVEENGARNVVQVTVDDSGFGIPEAHRDTVFEKFQQHAEALTDKPAGTGLGLAICRLAIERMGGTIWCEDSDLGGARLTFVLPATQLVKV